MRCCAADMFTHHKTLYRGRAGMLFDVSRWNATARTAITESCPSGMAGAGRATSSKSPLGAGWVMAVERGIAAE